ncbi:MAG: dihydrofolate reductase [Alphaproteobacteria bacterium]|nr:dihydrofolate reductase [Alphaproteobacteria bacterium]
MAIILIAACAGARQVIGDKGRLPWHFPSDLKFFKQATLDGTVLMGRTTYDAILTQFGRPLPRRRHLIVSRDATYHPEGTEVFASIPAALAAVPTEQDVFVAGGAQVYLQTLRHANIVLLTHIDAEITGDACFPLLDPAEWQATETNRISENGVTLRFCRYERCA